MAGAVAAFSTLVRVGVIGWVPWEQKWRWSLVCSRFTRKCHWHLHPWKGEGGSKTGQREGSVVMPVGFYTFLYLCCNQSLDVGHPDGAVALSKLLSAAEAVLEGVTIEGCVLTPSPRVGQKALLGGVTWGVHLCVHLSKSLL